MHRACNIDHLKVAKWLFDAGAAEDLRTVDIFHHTTIFSACSNGHLEVAKWLFERDPTGAEADIKAEHVHGKPVLSKVLLEGQLEVAMWLCFATVLRRTDLTILMSPSCTHFVESLL
jgi:hypothetical protein